MMIFAIGLDEARPTAARRRIKKLEQRFVVGLKQGLARTATDEQIAVSILAPKFVHDLEFAQQCIETLRSGRQSCESSIACQVGCCT